MEHVVELEELWIKGRLKDVETDLDRFIRDHIEDIRAALREKASGTASRRHGYDRDLIDFCVRSILRRSGTCNPRRDIQEQVNEIGKEIWYEGERRRAPVPPDRCEEIAREWATRYAPRWREWRLLQLLYVWQKKADEYVPLIGAA